MITTARKEQIKNFTKDVVLPTVLIVITIGLIVLTSQAQKDPTVDLLLQQHKFVQRIAQNEERETLVARREMPVRKLSPGASVDFGVEDSPMLSWLLAFPGSGENDIITFIQKSTDTTTATNYGQNILSPTGRVRYAMVDSIPVYVARPHGPYLYTHHKPIPSTTIPTLSYCGGYCNDCYPGKYILHRDAFIAQCAGGFSFTHIEGPHGPTGEGTRTLNKYDTKLVERAVVVVRNPYNVMQDRFIEFSRSYEHLDHRDHEWLPKFVMNSEGFQHYCKIQAVKFADEESKWYDPQIFQQSLSVPCHADMYRYVQWYNLVFESLDFMEIPYIIVHYEDFDNDFEGIDGDMLNFLGLEKNVTVAPEWYSQGDRGYFSEEDRRLLKEFITALATPVTMREIGRYLDY